MTTLYLEPDVTGVSCTRKGRNWQARATARMPDNLRVTGKGSSSDFDTAVRYALLDLRGRVIGTVPTK